MPDQIEPPQTPPKKTNAGWFKGGNDPRRATYGANRKSPTGKTLPALARLHTEDAINVVATILMNADASDKDRLQAAALLFARGWGLPSQSISIDAQVSHAHVATTIDAKLIPLETRSQILAALREQDSQPAIFIEAQPLDGEEPDE